MLQKKRVNLMALTVSSAMVIIASMLQTKPVEAGQGYKLPFPAGKNVPINQSCVDSIDGIGCNHSGYPSIKYAVDFGCNLGDAVVAIQDGRVAKKGFNGTGYEGYGNYVVIEHPNGKGSLYAHLQEASNVNVNDNIKRGQQVGKCGGTTSVGKTFPIHLHLELRPQWNTWSTEKIYFDECDGNSNCRDGQVYNPKSYISQNSIASNNAWMMVGNPITNTQSANVTIKFGDQIKGNYTIAPGQVITPTYPNLMGGPIEVASTNGVNIFSTQRVFSKYNASNELSGIANNKLATKYYYPWYDATGGNQDWIMVGNPKTNTQTANVTIKIGGQVKGNYTIAPGSVITPQYAGVTGGQVEVISTNGVRIFTSQRVFTIYNSSNEVAGIPDNSLTTKYYFSWYDSANGNTAWTMVGNPSSQTANVTIKIAGQIKGNYSVAPGQVITPVYAGVVGGPVEVTSTNNVPIFTSQRVFTVYKSSNEVMGIPANSVTTRYYFPWYDTAGGNMAWTMVGNPSGQTANVTVKIGGQVKGTFSIPPGGVITPQYSGLVGGPVEVISTNNIPIFSSQRIFTNYKFSDESLGLPGTATTYYFPWYDTK